MAKIALPYSMTLKLCCSITLHVSAMILLPALAYFLLPVRLFAVKETNKQEAGLQG